MKTEHNNYQCDGDAQDGLNDWWCEFAGMKPTEQMKG